jgi:hypothetical protein
MSVKVAKARYQASKRHPYVAETLFAAIIVPDADIDTCRFTPGTFRANETFFAMADAGVTSEAVAHEMGHFIFNTAGRARKHQELTNDGRLVAADPEKFWFAGCLAVNDWLRSCGWAPELVPESVGLEPNHTTEWYYDHLPPTDAQQKCACAHGREDEEDLARAEACRAGIAGQLPGTHASDEVLSFIAKYKTRFDWTRILHRTLVGAHDAGHVELPTFTRPSKREGGQAGVRLTGRKSTGQTEVAVILDTSGSVTDDIRSRFASVLKRLAETTSFRLVTNDAAVHASEDVYSWRDVLPMVRGGGGTDFCPAFAHLQTLGKKWSAIYVLTDGMAFVPHTKPFKCPIYWLIYGEGPQPATWGTTVRLEE